METRITDIKEAARIAADLPAIEQAVGSKAGSWAHNCHLVSLKLLRTGLFGPGRIARGWAGIVTGQHSWVVLSEDVYDPAAIVIDPTIWSYAGQQPYVAVIENRKLHHPHGSGDVFASPPPQRGTGPQILLSIDERTLPVDARALLFAIGGLDRRGWMQFASGPMEGIPGMGEIIAAMLDTDELKAVVPIDIAGMLTDRNPNQLYR
jgi:hypothetical protein